jgi:hypothetical protein
MPTRHPLLAALLALAALPLLLAGCKIETINYFPRSPRTSASSTSSRMRRR